MNVWERLRQHIDDQVRTAKDEILSTGKGEVDGTVIDFTKPADWDPRNDYSLRQEIAVGGPADGIFVFQPQGQSYVIPLTVETVAAKYATAPNDGPMRDLRRHREFSQELAGLVHQAEHYGINYRRNQK